MDNVLSLLEDLQEIFETAKAVPFTNKISVDKDEVFDVLTSIKLQLPNEIKQSKWVIEERNKILIDAQKEADEIIKGAEEKLARLIDENEVTKRAYDQANLIIENSKKASKEMRIGANDYADEVLSMTESKLKEMIEMVHNECQQCEEFLNQTLGVIYDNRQELKNGK